MDDKLVGRQRDVSEEVLTVIQRAKDRRLEEMKRFELQQQLEATKLKKKDGENKVNFSNYLYIFIKYLFSNVN